MANSAKAFAAFAAPGDLSRLAVVLVSPRNPLNIGAVARAMSNFGCDDLRLVRVHDPSYQEAVSAVGPSAEILRGARRFEALAEAIADCGLVYGTLAPHGRLPEQPMLALPLAAQQLRAAMNDVDGIGGGGSRAALLFGSEKTGLSNHDFSHCHGVVGIPSRAEHASMNLGQAAAVCLYAAAQAGLPPMEMRETALASAEHVDRITTLLSESLAAVNYVGIGRAWADDNLRSLVRRMRIPQEDASALTGMLRKILWVLKSKETRDQLSGTRD